MLRTNCSLLVLKCVRSSRFLLRRGQNLCQITQDIIMPLYNGLDYQYDEHTIRIEGKYIEDGWEHDNGKQNKPTKDTAAPAYLHL